MNLTRRSLLLGVSAATAATLAACTGSNGSKGTDANKSASGAADGKLSGEITFQTWSLKNEKFTPYFEALVKSFQDEHPGTTVKWIDQPGDGYEEKVLQQANSSELPDVINLPEGFAFQLAQVNKLVDLKKADEKALSPYFKGGLAAYTYSSMEGTYGYPWYLGTDLCWWNKDQLAEADVTPESLPKTQDEYLALAKEVATKTSGKVKLLATVPILSDFEAAGVTLFKDGKFTFNSGDAAKELQKYVDAYATGAMPSEALNDDYTGNAKMFTQEKVAYTTATPSFVTQMTNDSPNLLDKVAVTKRLVTPPLFVQGLSVSADSKNPDLALAFAQYVTNNANQVAFVKIAQGFVPGTIEGIEHPETLTADIKDNKLLTDAVKLAAEEMKEAKANSVIQYTDDMKKHTGQQIALALKGEVTAQQALDNAVKYCNDNIKS